MPQLFYQQPQPEPIPPIPPRTRSRPPSRQQPSGLSVVPNQKKTYLRFDDLSSPDREWQLLENIGDGTYGEVFRVS